MSSLDRASAERAKLIQEKCQSILTSMLSDTDNKYCVDCDAKGPRWVSWNLGVFLCIRCAGIHRNLGVHISKVKSVNLDSWKPEQVVMLQQIGNSRARAAYEANLPDNFRRPQADMALESFIRAKYEHNKYTAREWVPPQVPKVCWDAEIDALRRRDGPRRPGGRGMVETPVLPAISKPRPPAAAVATPAAAVSTPAAAAAPQSTTNGQSHTADLLGISTGESSGIDNNVSGSSAADLFGDFLAASAPPTGNTATSVGVSSAGKTADELSFFSQTVSASPSHVAPPAVAQNSTAAGAAAGGQSGGAAGGQSGGAAGGQSGGGTGGPMSRDSIMALYGTPQQQQSTAMGLTSPIGGGVFGMSTSGGVAGGFTPPMYTPSPVSQVPLQYQQTGTPIYQQQGYAAVPHQYQSGTQHNNYPYQMHQQMSSLSLGTPNAPPAASNMTASVNLMSSTMNRSH